MFNSFLYRLFLAVQLITVAFSAISDNEIIALVQQMRQQDLNGNAAKQGDIVVNYQNEASHTHPDHDNAPQPFFTRVNENLFNGLTYQAYLNLTAQFVTPNVFVPEPVTPAQTASSYTFIDAIKTTTVFNTMFNFLTSKGLALTWPIFREQLHTLWFGLYSRGGNGALGSSGFENVFVGEHENTAVDGQYYWVRFYMLEKAKQIDYHGWFDRQKDVQISMQWMWGTHEKLTGDFLIGTSPEFDFSLFTLCVLARPGVNTCPFKLDTYSAFVTSSLDNSTSVMKVNTAYSSITTGGSAATTTGRPNTDGLGALVLAMRAADVGKAQPGDIVLNWGNHVSGDNDVSPNPLFTHVNENLFKRETYDTLIRIHNSTFFDPEVCHDEITTGLKTALEHHFIDLVTNTSVFRLAFQYLQAHGAPNSGDLSTFTQYLYNLWFGTYSRCSPHVGSSGWEHVYSGEFKGNTVDGQHNWVRFYRLEKYGAINYFGNYNHDGDLIGTIEYTWQQHLKKIGGFLIGTSPEFDFSLFTVCVLMASGDNACKFVIDGYNLEVTSFKQNCSVGQCLATSYPAIPNN